MLAVEYNVVKRESGLVVLQPLSEGSEEVLAVETVHMNTTLKSVPYTKQYIRVSTPLRQRPLSVEQGTIV